jgi:hypothetical protein
MAGTELSVRSMYINKLTFPRTVTLVGLKADGVSRGIYRTHLM